MHRTLALMILCTLFQSDEELLISFLAKCELGARGGSTKQMKEFIVHF